MSRSLSRITIRGFRSIRELNLLPLGKLNVLVGANGAGKSNFIDFFRLLRAMAEGGLQRFVRENGGADGFCFDGPKVTPSISAHLNYGDVEYRFSLEPLVSGEMAVSGEGADWAGGGLRANLIPIALESHLFEWSEKKSGSEKVVAEAAKGSIVYHVHDTSKTSGMRRRHPLSNFRELQPDAANIAPFLRQIRAKHELHYRRICDTVRLVAPFFDDFILDEESEGENETTRLEWKQRGSSFPYQPWHLSDGTIRFICLATALLQPQPPSTILIDEPELGLHPFALEILASLLHEASERAQLIVSTQSPSLLDRFEPEDAIVVDREEGASEFRRLDAGALASWMDQYALGDLLRKNVIEAAPRYES